MIGAAFRSLIAAASRLRGTVPEVAGDDDAEPALSPAAPAEHTAGARAALRARSQVGTGRYRLGRGGRRPTAPSPLDGAGECDCSGFASWAIELDRKDDRIGGGWISTDSIVRDATGPRVLFEVLAPADCRPGDLVVYPGRYVGGRRVAIGHVGVIVEAADTIARCRVVHCHGPTGQSPAIEERDGRPWATRGIVVRLR